MLGAVNSSLYCIIIFNSQLYELFAIIISNSFLRKIMIYSLDLFQEWKNYSNLHL